MCKRSPSACIFDDGLELLVADPLLAHLVQKDIKGNVHVSNSVHEFKGVRDIAVIINGGGNFVIFYEVSGE